MLERWSLQDPTEGQLRSLQGGKEVLLDDPCSQQTAVVRAERKCVRECEMGGKMSSTEPSGHTVTPVATFREPGCVCVGGAVGDTGGVRRAL